MQSLSLLDDGCHANSRSSVAALAAHRQTEFDLGFPTRVLDFIHSPFGIEHVVHIENTESHLIMTAFQFFAGEHSSWAIRSFRTLTILEKNTTHLTVPGGIKSGPEVETQLNLTSEDTFWLPLRVAWTTILISTQKRKLNHTQHTVSFSPEPNHTIQNY